MKILYLITKSNWGGAQKYVFDLAIAMKERDQEVLVAFGGNGLLKEKLEENNIKTIKVKNLERDINIIKELKVFIDLYKLFKKEKPSIIHLNSSKIGGAGAFIGRLSGIKKIIYTAHGFPFREDRILWQIIFIKFLSWLTIIFAHKTICVSQKDFDDVEKWPFIKNKIFIIHNGIETKILEKVSENKKSDLENNVVKIVSIGELHRNKGFEFGIQTINILKNKIKNFTWTILSFGGEEKDKLENMIKENDLEKYIKLDINKRNHAEELNSYDIYFMPSIKEGLPYVLLEAGLFSLPIVSGDTGGVKEIVEDNKNGFLVFPKDVNNFARTLEKLILYKNLREEFGKYGKEKIKKHFSLEKMINSTEEIYF